MAKKNKTVFVCQECGYESSKWMGRCICGAWNTMVEEKVIELNVEDKRRRTSSREAMTGSGAFSSGTALSQGKAGKPVKLSGSVCIGRRIGRADKDEGGQSVQKSAR